MSTSAIALLTDFGTKDFFAASLKGAIMRINPLVRIVDMSHDLDSFDIPAASFFLSACSPYYPEGTIFLSVVDPGVGSRRRILMAEAGGRFYIGPDNGLLTRVLMHGGNARLVEVTEERYFIPSTGRTFEARDKMAPAAAWLSTGVAFDRFGPEVRDYEKIDIHFPVFKDSVLTGHVAYIDKFGNIITDIKTSLVKEFFCRKSYEDLVFEVKGEKTSFFSRSYEEGKKERMMVIEGSLGFMEIAVFQGSAAARTGARMGEKVFIKKRDGETKKTLIHQGKNG